MTRQIKVARLSVSPSINLSIRPSQLPPEKSFESIVSDGLALAVILTREIRCRPVVVVDSWGDEVVSPSVDFVNRTCARDGANRGVLELQ